MTFASRIVSIAFLLLAAGLTVGRHKSVFADPTISAQVRNVSASAATIVFTTPALETDTVSYFAATDSSCQTALGSVSDGADETIHEIQLTGLSAGTEYLYQVTGPSGNSPCDPVHAAFYTVNPASAAPSPITVQGDVAEGTSCNQSVPAALVSVSDTNTTSAASSVRNEADITSSTPSVDDGLGNPIATAFTIGFAPAASSISDPEDYFRPTSGDLITVTITDLAGHSAAESATWDGSSNPMTLANTLCLDPGRPSAPTSVAVDGSATSATVTWSPPSSRGGGIISGYLIQVYDCGGTGVAADSAGTCGAQPDETTTTGPCLSCSQVVSGLGKGTVYRFDVSAENTAVDSYGPLASAYAATLPGGVQSSSIAASSDTSALTALWNAPLDGEPAIDSYAVSAIGPCTTTNVATCATAIAASGAGSCSGSACSAILLGLITGKSYKLTVTPHDASGFGPTSTSTATFQPNQPPSAPTIVGPTSGRYGQRLGTSGVAVKSSDSDRDVLLHSLAPSTAADSCIVANAVTGAVSCRNGIGILLPSGLVLSRSSGLLTGTIRLPAGSYTFSFVVNDGHSSVSSAPWTLTVSPAVETISAGIAKSFTSLSSPAVMNPRFVGLSLGQYESGNLTFAFTLTGSATDPLRSPTSLTGPSCPANHCLSVTITNPDGSGGPACPVSLVLPGTVRPGQVGVECSLSGLPDGTYGVQASVYNGYYAGIWMTTFTVADSTLNAGAGDFKHGLLPVDFGFTDVGGSGTLSYIQHDKGKIGSQTSAGVDDQVLQGSITSASYSTAAAGPRLSMTGSASLNGVAGYTFQMVVTPTTSGLAPMPGSVLSFTLSGGSAGLDADLSLIAPQKIVSKDGGQIELAGSD